MAKVNENGLNIKQQLFADYYLANGCNATRAYKEAYKSSQRVAEVNGTKLLGHTRVAAYVEKRQAEIKEQTTVTQEFVVKSLKEVAKRCMQQEPVMEFDNESKSLVQSTAIDENGNEIGLYKFDSAGANKALELLGKTLGIFKDKKELSTPEGGIIINLVDDVVE